MARQTEVSIDVVTMTMMMITTNDDDDDDNCATHDSRCQSRPGVKCIDLDGIKPSWARKDLVKKKYLWFTLHKTMTAQARYMVSQGNCPCLTSGRTAKDPVAQTQIHRGQDDLGFSRS